MQAIADRDGASCSLGLLEQGSFAAAETAKMRADFCNAGRATEQNSANPEILGSHITHNDGSLPAPDPESLPPDLLPCQENSR